jgi:hypothetical protein
VLSRRYKWLFASIVVAFLFVAVALVFWIKFGPEYEACSPDYFDFGTVAAGSTWECSARFLTIDRKSTLERMGERVANWCPKAWEPTLRRWTVRPKPVDFPKLDLSTLKPMANAPDFVQVKSVTPQQNKYWYNGRSYVSVLLKLNTTRPGNYAGKVKVTLGRRESSLPIRFRVRDATSGERVLVTASPYQEFATEDGSSFAAVTRVLSSLTSVDCTDELPATVEPYRTILLGDSALSRISPKDVTRMRTFVEKGGRLILPCDAFFQGTIPKANEILAGYGLMVVTNDMGGNHHATNIISDPLTRGVTRLEFYRPSPIVVTDSGKGKLLALDPRGAGGFVAMTRAPGGGEIIVITASLWWNWVGQFKDNPDNSRLLQNVLSPGKRD